MSTRTRTANGSRDREELLSRASNALDPMEMFASAAEGLRRIVPYDAAVWRAADPLTGVMTAPIHLENLDGGGCPVYWEHELLDKPVNRFSDLARARVPVAGLWQSTGGLPARSSLYQEFMRPRGVHDELRAVLRADGQVHGYVSLFRDRGRDAFSSTDTGFISGLVKPLARRLRSYAAPLTVAPMDGVPSAGLLLYDPDMELVSVNEAAIAYMEALPEGPSSPSKLGYRIPLWVHGTAVKARAIVLARDRGQARIRLRTRDGRWLVCHASCLRASDGTPQSFVVVLEPARPSDVTPLLAEAYGLSDRELEVARCAARGMATEAIARKLFLSAHTVRDHLKATFEKVQVSSRGELVSRLFVGDTADDRAAVDAGSGGP